MQNSKLKKYLKLRSNPNLALFSAIENLEKKVDNKVKEIEQDLDSKIKKAVEQKEPMNSGFIEKIVSKITSNLVQDTKGDKGERGDRGEMGQIGDKGDSIKGEPGIQGIQGEIGLTGNDGQDGQDGKDGKIPIAGIDYFIEKDKQLFIKQIKTMIKFPELDKKIDDLKNLIEEMKKKQELQKFGGQRTLHRGGATFVWNELIGTGNNSTTDFDLDNTPYDTTKLAIYVGVGRLFLTDDFTIAGKTITFLIAPPTDYKIRADYQKK